MLESLKNQISFFIDCYQHENQNTRIEKIGSKNAEMFLTSTLGDEMIALSQGFEITLNYAVEASKILHIYRKEKELKIYFLGILQEGDIVPLFIYNGKIEIDKGAYNIFIDFDSVFVNPCALEKCTDFDAEKIKDIENKLLRLVQSKEINLLLLLEIWTFFDEHNIPYSHEEDLKIDVAGIRKVICSGIVTKSTNTRGILEDLKNISSLSEQQSIYTYSDPVVALFTSSNKAKKRDVILDYKLLPYTLSYGQYRIFDSIKNNSLSVLIGPPGTGKTFTLVALALEAVRTGKSILICAKTDQALDVIEKKLKHEFDNHDLILRVGYGNKAKKLKQVIKDFISKKNVKPISTSEVKSQRERAKNQYGVISKLEKEIVEHLEVEEDFGKIVYKEDLTFLDRINLFWLRYKITDKNIVSEKISRLRVLYKARYIVNRQLVNIEHNYRVSKNYSSLKENLISYQKSLVARISTTRDFHLKRANFFDLIQVLPIWLVNTSDLNRSIPLKKELFDFLFIDEASQCEVTLGIPALQRAKKAIVAGDPKQLNHISFLPKTFVEESRSKHKVGNKPYFDYRSYSLLDMVDAVTLHSDNEGVLEEHYRSQPSIIGFNNHHFYQNRLKVMTAHGSHRTENAHHFIQIEGVQKDDNSNLKELEFIMSQIQELFEQEKHKTKPNSIGIISPFRNQADAFKRYALNNLDTEIIERHDILIGTPFEFQGEERDIVFISLAVDDNSASGSFAYLSRENMLNVATSRAKSTQYIVFSFDKSRLSKGGLLHKFFEFQHHQYSEVVEIRDVFAKEVKSELLSNGISSITQDEIISGISIDLLLHGETNDLCIDLIGYEGAYDNVLNLEEIESLFRSDKHVYVLPYRHWEKNKAREIAAIYTHFVTINEV